MSKQQDLSSVKLWDWDNCVSQNKTRRSSAP